MSRRGPPLSTLTTARDPKRYAEVIREVLGLISSGRLVPTVFEPSYDGLKSVPQGLLDIEARKTWGKAVIRVKSEAAKL